MRKRINYLKRFERDLLFVGVSILLSIILVRIGIIEEFLTYTEGVRLVGVFISGIFFTSVFTIAPATVALAEIAQAGSPFVVALTGAVGAVIGDVLIFFFLRDTFTEDLMGTLKKFKVHYTLESFHLGFMKWLAPVLGGIIIASPLPDELGLMLMGLSKTKLAVLLPIAFVMNFLGILLIAFVTRVL